MSEPENSPFSVEQRVRARALDAARAVLVERALFGSGSVSSIVDLITLAQWIIDGQTPWLSDVVADDDTLAPLLSRFRETT